MLRKDFIKLSALFGGGLFSGSAFANKSRPIEIDELVESAKTIIESWVN